MEPHLVIGGALCLAGLADLALLPVLRRRIGNENQRRILTVALLSSTVLMTGLGCMFLFGVIQL